MTEPLIGPDCAWPCAHPLGLAYADGLFETMRVVDGRIPLWPLHRARLDHSLRRLRLVRPDWEKLDQQIDQLAGTQREAVLKLVCYSAAAGRGYRRDQSQLRWRLERHPLPAPQAQLSARTVGLRLSGAASLAGLKSLARLEQRIAATEADGGGADVALLRHRNGEAVSFSHGNLFVLDQGRLVTPPLNRGALGGVMRCLLLKRGPVPARVAPVRFEQLSQAEAVLCTNAVRGIQTVAVLDGKRLRPYAEVDFWSRWFTQLMHQWRDSDDGADVLKVDGG